MIDSAEIFLVRSMKCTPGLLKLGGRIHPMVAPPTQKQQPFAVYIRRSTNQNQTFNGPENEILVNFSVTLFDLTYTGARAMAKAYREHVDGFAGSAYGAIVLRVVLSSDADTFILSDGGDLVPFYGVELGIELRLRQ